jgi:phosphoribosyl 1,2-cyclic phosphodiesterase
VHVLASGSDGNCTVVASEDTLIMIDAGISGRRITKLMGGAGLDPKDLDAILLTHEHSDHVSGAGIMSRKYGVPICCNENTLVCSNVVHPQLQTVRDDETIRDRLP